MAPNKKKEALGRQLGRTYAELEYLGFGIVAGLFTLSSGTGYGSKINDPDTWTSPLADDQADYTREDVDNLKDVFTNFFDALREEYKKELDDVDSGSREARWPDV